MVQGASRFRAFRVYGELIALRKSKEFHIPEAMEDLLEAQEASQEALEEAHKKGTRDRRVQGRSLN